MTLIERSSELIAPANAVATDPFYFDLKGHELNDPRTLLGEVVGISQSAEIVSVTSEEGDSKTIQPFTIRVQDPFVASDPIAREIVTEHVEGMEGALRSDGFDPLAERQKKYPYGTVGLEKDGVKNYYNPYTLRWLEQSALAGLKAWHSGVPHAKALGHLTKPFVGASILDRKGVAYVSSPETAAHLRHVDDAVGIRDRATAMRWLAEQHLSNIEKDQTVSWLSLACGTAEPSIVAAKDIMNKTGGKVDLHVLDYDAEALATVSLVATEQQYKGKVTVHQGDLLNPNYPDIIREQSSIQQYDIVENLGFEEYLPQAGDSIGAFKKMEGLLPEASEFTRKAWELVAPGGMLISGNMILNRPQLDFVFGIVAWPIINARQEEEILRVYERAGILDDSSAELKMFQVVNVDTDTAVYNIVTVTKKP